MDEGGIGDFEAELQHPNSYQPFTAYSTVNRPEQSDHRGEDLK